MMVTSGSHHFCYLRCVYQLNETELFVTCLLLLIVGHEATGNLITNGFYLIKKNNNLFVVILR